MIENVTLLAAFGAGLLFTSVCGWFQPVLMLFYLQHAHECEF